MKFAAKNLRCACIDDICKCETIDGQKGNVDLRPHRDDSDAQPARIALFEVHTGRRTEFETVLTPTELEAIDETARRVHARTGDLNPFSVRRIA